MGSTLEKYGWGELLCHTNFSFLTGASHPSEYVTRALELGYQGIGVTDLDGVYGLARTFLEYKKLRSHYPNLQLQYGAELHLAKDHDLPIVYRDTVALIARSHTGYTNLCRIMSEAHAQGKHNAYLSLEKLMTQDVEDLIAIQPMRGRLRRAGVLSDYHQRCDKLKSLFGKDLRFAVSRHLNMAEDTWIQPTLQIAKELDVACVLSQDPFFHAPVAKPMSDLMQAIRTNLPLDDCVEHMFVNAERSLHDLQQIDALYSPLPIYAKALRNMKELREVCTFSLEDLRYHYPQEMLPPGHTAQSFLEKLTWETAYQRFGSSLPSNLSALLQREISLIRHLQFADYFLTVWDIVRWAREQDILCQGRGSAANSVVCYVLGITSIDPDQIDMLFERFISVERGDPPDIDVDFEHERREEVIQYIYKRYGRDKAAMVANVITFQRRGALRATAKALGIPETVAGKVSKVLRMRFFRGKEAIEAITRSRQELVEEGELSPEQSSQIPWRYWARLADRLYGYPRHLGIHSGGFLLSDQSLHALVAQEPATMAGRSVVQWCKEDIEGLYFFKIDLLALGMLTAVRKCFAMLKESYQKDMKLDSVPQDDPDTYAMIQKAETVGTFQIESRAQMSMLPRLRPKDFYDLVIEIAIIRPGPIQGGMIHPFLRRREGLEPVHFPDERLRPVLERTLGVPIFQEQVMRIAMAVGDFTAGEANEMRRKMGSWSIKGDISPWLERLERGMKRNGIDEEFAASVLGHMRGFAHYGFPESHSASFALLAYASSYLKCHYPAAFFTSLLNSQPMGFYTPHALISAAKRDGVQVLPICVNKSDWDNKLEWLGDDYNGYAIRLGFRLVNSLSQTGAERLIETREQIGGAWGDAEHFLQTVQLYRNDLTALAAADALHSLGVERRAALWLAEAAPFCPVLEDIEEELTWEEETPWQKMQQDFSATSTSLGPHPAELVRKKYWTYPTPLARLQSARSLSSTAADSRVRVFGMILIRQAPPSASGMVFLTLEDETGYINLAFAPPIYDRFHREIESQAFLCIEGIVQRVNESHSLMVKKVIMPQFTSAEVVPLAKGKREALRQEAAALRKAKELFRTRNYM